MKKLKVTLRLSNIPEKSYEEIMEDIEQKIVELCEGILCEVGIAEEDDDNN